MGKQADETCSCLPQPSLSDEKQDGGEAVKVAAAAAVVLSGLEAAKPSLILSGAAQSLADPIFSRWKRGIFYAAGLVVLIPS